MYIGNYLKLGGQAVHNVGGRGGGHNLIIQFYLNEGGTDYVYHIITGPRVLRPSYGPGRLLNLHYLYTSSSI